MCILLPSADEAFIDNKENNKKNEAANTTEHQADKVPSEAANSKMVDYKVYT